jgi:ligand-binding sensor domain-containing protein/signal transduction histidine kinase
MYIQRRKLIVIVAFMIMGIPGVFAQDLYFRHITTDNGLVNGNVRTILQDYQGFIWFGTEDGLQRYDGHSTVTYYHKDSDSTSLSSNYILSLFEDSQKNLWIGTLDAGLCWYDRKNDSFIRFLHDPSDEHSILGNYVRAIHESEDHVLYFGLEHGGFSHFKTPSDVRADLKFTNIAIPNREGFLSTNLVGTIIEDFDHTMLVGSNGGGINRFNPKTKEFSPFLKDSCATSVHHVFLDSKKRIWIGTWDSGLYIYDRFAKRMIHHTNNGQPGSISQNQIETIAEDREGNFWIGTDNGLCLITKDVDPFLPNPFITYKHNEFEASSLLSNSIKAFYIDARNKMWVGSYYGGINVHDKDAFKFKPVTSKPWAAGSLTSSNVFAFEEDKQGNLWVGTDGGGLHVALPPKDPERIVFSKINMTLDNIPVNKIKCLEFDHDGYLWIGTWGMGIFRFDPRSRQYIHYGRAANGLLTDDVLNIKVDSLNNLWIGTFNGGLHYFDQKNKKFTYFQKFISPGKHGNIQRITAIHIARNKMLWVAREVGGLTRYDATTRSFRVVETGVLTRYVTIQSIYEDTSGVMWLATTTSGLIKFDPRTNEVKQYNKESGMINDVIYAVLPDTVNHKLWLSTNLGLTVLDLSTNTIENYSKADGLQGNQFNQGSALLHSNGLMLFGGTQGMNIFDPGKIKKDLHFSPMVFTRFWLNNVETNVKNQGSPLKQNFILADTIDLSYNQNSFSIEFVMLEFNFGRDNQYSYLLENFNSAWQNIGSERKATFTNLQPGSYVLKVKASNSDGFWNDKEMLLTIRIHPAWWQTLWFKISLATVLALLIFAAVRLRFHFLLKQKIKLEQQVAERTIELQLQNKLLQTQKIEIAAMNNEIQAQNEELTSQNDQINLQRESLEKSSKELQEMNDQLEVLVKQRTQKLEVTIAELDKTVAELDRFVYSASHDLSAPLKSVLGLVKIARIEKDSAMLPKYYTYIETSIQKLDRVIRSLVEFSRNSHQEVKKESFNLHQLINEVLQELKYWPEAQRVTFDNRVATDMLIVSDQDRLKVILHNLIGNGVKYADFRKTESFITIEAETKNSSLVLKISDNGIGIENEKQEKIFDMYYRGTDRSKGSGLGLFIVKEILAKVDGRVELESELGKGTTFTIYLQHHKI